MDMESKDDNQMTKNDANSVKKPSSKQNVKKFSIRLNQTYNISDDKVSSAYGMKESDPKVSDNMALYPTEYKTLQTEQQDDANHEILVEDMLMRDTENGDSKNKVLNCLISDGFRTSRIVVLRISIHLFAIQYNTCQKSHPLNSFPSPSQARASHAPCSPP